MAAPPPKVSVIVPAYNAAPFIERGLASALDQDGVDVEIIVVDDGSTDDTCELVQSLAAANPRIRLLRLERNSGPSVARNRALDAATGDWIAVLDADDAYSPGRLRRLVDIGNQYDADIIADNFHFYDAIRNELSPPALSTSPSVERLSIYDFVDRARGDRPEGDYGLLQPVLRSSFVERHHLRYPVLSRHGEDFLFVFEILAKGAVFILSRKPGYLYTNRNSGFSRTQVDYKKMSEESIALLGRPEISQDLRLRHLMLRRIEAVKWLHAQHTIRTHLPKARFGKLLMEATKNPRVAIVALRKVKDRLASHIRRKDSAKARASYTGTPD